MKQILKEVKKKSAIINLLIPVLIVCLLAYIYRSIFISPITSAGDLPYYWEAHIKELGVANLWNPHWPTGLGGSQSIVLPLKLYFQLPIVLFVQQLHIPWEIVQRIIFFWAFFVLSIYSSYRLTKSWIGSLIYASNTWILMVFSGGQIGVALGYSLAPLILFFFMHVIEKASLRSSLVTGLLLALQLIFDLRITYVTLLGVGLYLLLNLSSLLKKGNRGNIIFFIIPFIIAGLLNLFWLLPLVTVSSSLPSVSLLNPTLKEVIFFSFSTFPNTMGFLHPNWPENIFGKISFMRPEFLILPLIAFASLLFVQTKLIKSVERKRVLFFALVGLLGAFLAKGANEPLGGLYLWLFEHIPGFNLFRDPTKFYVLIAFAYSFLIPFTLTQLSNTFTQRFKKQKYMLLIVSFMFIAYWGFLIRPVFFNELGGLFKSHPIPQEYLQLQESLSSDKSFSRTLWIPQYQRFGYFSDLHPAINAADLAKEMKDKNTLSFLKKQKTLSQLQQMSVKYVILPSDTNGEIFVKDRSYDEKTYQKFLKDLKKQSWLKEKERFGKMIVFEVPDPKDHFWFASGDGTVSYKTINPTQYQLTLKNVKAGDRLVFSEKYDPQWIAKESHSKQEGSKLFAKYFNSFVLSRSGNYAIEISYQAQNLTNIGLQIGMLTLFIVFSSLLLFLFKRR